MHLERWAIGRAAAAEPGLGVAGPLLWTLAAVCLAAALWGTTLRDAELFVALMVTMAAALGLATSPIWMIRTAVSRHHRRHATQRAEAQALATHLGAAFVEGHLEEDEFHGLDERTGDIRHGRSQAALAATGTHYLRGLAWSFPVAGTVITVSALYAWATMDRWHREQGDSSLEPLMGAAVTVAAAAFLIGMALAVVFGIAAAATQKRARRLAGEDATFLAATKERILKLRRTA